MCDQYPMVKTLLQTSTNGSCQLPRDLQQKMNDLFHGLEFICVEIDNLLILTKWEWTDNVNNLELILNKLKEKIFKYDIEKPFFGQTKMEFVGFSVT